VFTVVFALGVLALLAFATFETRDEAFTLGVAPALPLEAPAGKTLCQRPIDVPVPFDRAQVTLADGTAKEGLVRDARSGEPIRAPVREGRRIEVCIRGPATVLGNAELASRSSEAVVGDKPLKADMAVVFMRSESRSLLSLVPDVVSRASLFHGSWVKPWVVGFFGVLLLTAFPLLLAAALRESCESSGPSRHRARRRLRSPSARVRD
jgi:hypothetical protein